MAALALSLPELKALYIANQLDDIKGPQACVGESLTTFNLMVFLEEDTYRAAIGDTLTLEDDLVWLKQNPNATTSEQ